MLPRMLRHPIAKMRKMTRKKNECSDLRSGFIYSMSMLKKCSKFRRKSSKECISSQSSYSG